MVLLYDVSVSNTYTHNPPLPNDLQLQVGITGEPSSDSVAACKRSLVQSCPERVQSNAFPADKRNIWWLGRVNFTQKKRFTIQSSSPNCLPVTSRAGRRWVTYVVRVCWFRATLTATFYRTRKRYLLQLSSFAWRRWVIKRRGRPRLTPSRCHGVKAVCVSERG